MFTSLNIGIIGIYEIIICECVTHKHKELAKKVDDAKGTKYFSKQLENLLKNCQIEKYVLKNIVPTVGLEVIAENLSNQSPAAAYKMAPSYGALGTGDTAAALGDTKLVTESYRDTITSQSRSGALSYNVLHLGLSVGNGVTYKEGGLFAGAATGAADSGKLMSRVVFAPTFAKDASKTLTFKVTHTFSNA